MTVHQESGDEEIIFVFVACLDSNASIPCCTSPAAIQVVRSNAKFDAALRFLKSNMLQNRFIIVARATFGFDLVVPTNRVAHNLILGSTQTVVLLWNECHNVESLKLMQILISGCQCIGIFGASRVHAIVLLCVVVVGFEWLLTLEFHDTPKSMVPRR